MMSEMASWILVIIASGTDLWPLWYQATTWINTNFLLIRFPRNIYFSNISLKFTYHDLRNALENVIYKIFAIFLDLKGLILQFNWYQALWAI